MVGKRVLPARKWEKWEILFLEQPRKRNNYISPQWSHCPSQSHSLPCPNSSTSPMSPTASPSPSTSNGEASVYDILREFNFPIGLLPEGAVGCRLDRTTGKLEADLNGSCHFSPEEPYELKYKSIISGRISRNRLTDLKGVSVKFMFFWVNIVEVVRNGNDLQFSIGVATASFPVDNFNECPSEGCGIYCNNGKGRKLKSKSLVSS